jgi:hypothetical protein
MSKRSWIYKQQQTLTPASVKLTPAALLMDIAHCEEKSLPKLN